MFRSIIVRGLCFAVLALLCADSRAIVIRHDVNPASYREPGLGPGYLVDLPHEGHAVLISERWLVTVAHTIFYDYTGVELSIGGGIYTIARVVVHPDYRELPKHVLAGDSEPLMQFLLDRSDIALIKLTHPVTDVEPIAIYRSDDERGMPVTIYGRGGTGNGMDGEDTATKAAKTLRRCENLITQTSDRWLSYTFAPPEMALPLEGMHGSGDSGGPAVARINGRETLVGLSCWQYFEGDLANFVGGKYGVQAYQVRVAAFANWIDNTIADGRDQ